PPLFFPLTTGVSWRWRTGWYASRTERFCGRIRQRKEEAKSCLGSMSDGKQGPWMRIQTHRMEPRRRIKYLILQAVSVVIYLPIPCLAEVAAIPDLTGAVVKSPRLFAENSDKEPLSLSLSSPRDRQVEESAIRQDRHSQNQSGAPWEPDEPLIISFSPVLSSLPAQPQV